MKKKLLTICALLALAFSSGYLPSGEGVSDRLGTATAQEQEMNKVIFKVKCYDEGKAVLQGMKGIQRIETGFHYFHETDTVYFDPKAITIEEMEAALKRAGTYVETLRLKERD